MATVQTSAGVTDAAAKIELVPEVFGMALPPISNYTRQALATALAKIRTVPNGAALSRRPLSAP